MRILFSPYKLPKVKFYLGKVKIGLPYFLPRKWVPITKAERVDKAIEFFNRREKNYEKLEREYVPPTGEEFLEQMESYKGYTKAVPKKFGYDIVALGWKTKYDSVRHEWNPMFSFVCFGLQLAVTVHFEGGIKEMCYWESWVYYRYYTNKGDSVEDRLKDTMKNVSCVWGKGGPDNEWTNYYNYILKDKYLKLIKE